MEMTRRSFVEVAAMGMAAAAMADTVALAGEAAEEEVDPALVFELEDPSEYWGENVAAPHTTRESAYANLDPELGDLPYTKATPGNNAFLNAANEYAANGCYVMEWATNFQPNSDAYRPAFVSALNAYNADQSDANWEQVVTAAIGGWAVQAAAAKG